MEILMVRKTYKITMESYDKEASSYSKVAILIWCVAGLIYTSVTWRILWLPGILILFPGIFIASLIAAIFFIPLQIIMKKVKEDWQVYGNRDWGLLMLGTILKISGIIGPIAGSIVYIQLIRYFIK
jgi:hypothetical protein